LKCDLNVKNLKEIFGHFLVSKVWGWPPHGLRYTTTPPPTHTQKNNVEGMDQKSHLLAKSDQKHFTKLLTLESDQNFFPNY